MNDNLESDIAEQIIRLRCSCCGEETVYSLSALIVPLEYDHPAMGNPPDGVPV